MALLANISVINATEPLQLKEMKSDETSVKFKPFYAAVPENWEVVTKSFDTAYKINYLLNNESVLSILERNYQGREMNVSNSTEIITKDNVEYYFTPYSKSKGGELCWVKNNIYFEMDSIHFDKSKIMEFAMTIR